MRGNPVAPGLDGGMHSVVPHVHGTLLSLITVPFKLSRAQGHPPKTMFPPPLQLDAAMSPTSR